MIFSDVSLARRLERAEARSNAGFVETRARIDPESGAEWIEVAGTYAMYDGVSSPLTQTFGLGLFDPVTAAELDRIEEFFHRRGAPVFHEVSPLADPQLLPLLGERGYRPIELSSVMFRPIGEELPARPANEQVRVRIAGPDEWELWARTAAQGWNEFPELSELMYGLGEVTVKRSDGVCRRSPRECSSSTKELPCWEERARFRKDAERAPSWPCWKADCATPRRTDAISP
jgi:hypothetical protein